MATDFAPEALIPIPSFEGRIGRTPAESEPSFTDRPHPGEDAPNVVIVLLDDTGFAQFGCYGSDIDTPNVDRLAAGGLQLHVSGDVVRGGRRACGPVLGVPAAELAGTDPRRAVLGHPRTRAGRHR